MHRAKISHGPADCIDKDASCLYFTGWEGSRNLASRYAATPPLDLRVLAAVYPPKWSTATIAQCTAGEKLVWVFFVKGKEKWCSGFSCLHYRNRAYSIYTSDLYLLQPEYINSISLSMVGEWWCQSMLLWHSFGSISQDQLTNSKLHTWFLCHLYILGNLTKCI